MSASQFATLRQVYVNAGSAAHAAMVRHTAKRGDDGNAHLWGLDAADRSAFAALGDKDKAFRVACWLMDWPYQYGRK